MTGALTSKSNQPSLPLPDSRQKRNRTLDFVRISLATMVLIAHAGELTEGKAFREPLVRLTHTQLSFGNIGVDFFFILSGYLIVRSWQLDARLKDFLKKRLLRILPGYVVAFFISVVVCGLIAPGTPHVFRELFHPPILKHFLISFFTLNSPWTPNIFPGLPYPGVNNSLWTLSYEFRCYLFVAAFGVLGLYRRRLAWLLATIALAIACTALPWIAVHGWHHLTWLFGAAPNDVGFLFAFLIGGCFYLYKAHIPLRPRLAILAVMLLAVSFAAHIQCELFLIVSGAYLLFWLEKILVLNKGWYEKIPDISYGMYIYGWPSQQLCIWFLHPPIWITFSLSLVTSVICGILSWYLVEKPMLALKPRPSAPLP